MPARRRPEPTQELRPTLDSAGHFFDSGTCVSRQLCGMASVRKRTWAYRGTQKSAWVVDYFDGDGVRRMKTFQARSVAVAWLRAARLDERGHVPTVDVRISRLLRDRLLARAAANGRTLSQEAELLLDQALQDAPRRDAECELLLDQALNPQPGSTADALIRRDTIEACAQIVDGFTCGGCGMDGKAGAAIRLLAKLPPPAADA